MRVSKYDILERFKRFHKGMLDEDIVKLRELESAGYPIAVCSGKPTFYLCGFMRQIGLQEPILVGENGAVIQYGVELPPERFYICPHSERAEEQLRHMKVLEGLASGGAGV